MSSNGRHNHSGLPETGVVTEWLYETTVTPAEHNKEAADWLFTGLRQWGKQTAFAESIGVPSQHLTEMMKGERVIYLRHALPLLGRNNLESAKAFLGWACQRSALTMPRPRSELVLTAEERRLLLYLRRSGMWKFIGPVMAREQYGVELDLLEAAIEYEASK